MGKPFATELAAFGRTYSWATEQPVEGLAEWVRSQVRHPLVVIGSGGSYTSAVYAALLHTLFTGRLAKAITPLELVSSPVDLSQSGLLLLSGGGGNPDILACLRRVREGGPARLGILCAKRGSPLAEQGSAIAAGGIFEYEPPSGKDGFLATNTLLATCVLVSRAYESAWCVPSRLPPSLDLLAHPGVAEADLAADLTARCRPLWGRETTVVLHGHATHPAAVDLESKFTEAAIGHLQFADYRNFAHGRHQWLARHGDTTGILALVAPEERPLAERTLGLLPDAVPAVRLDLPHDSYCGGLAAIVLGMRVAGLAGRSRGVDPGRPSVPSFGRRLYHLGGLRVPPLPDPTMAPEEAGAIEPKAGCSVTTLAAQGRLAAWRSDYARFRQAIRDGAFSAVVFDYDGTLCGAAERFTGPSAEVAGKLKELTRAGVVVGIATGRGQSVRRDLRRALPERSLWGRILVGYHNAGEIAWLTDGGIPPTGDELDESLQPLAAALRSDARLLQLVKIEAKLRQITLELASAADGPEVWERAEALLHRSAAPGVTLVRSSHSIDALAPGVSKALLVARVRSVLADGGTADGRILCIGDKGSRPGNDFALLAEPLALSVDEVSPDPATCWNLAAGARCVAATVQYLRAFDVGSGRFTVRL